MYLLKLLLKNNYKSSKLQNKPSFKVIKTQLLKVKSPRSKTSAFKINPQIKILKLIHSSIRLKTQKNPQTNHKKNHKN